LISFLSYIHVSSCSFFFFTHPPTTDIYTLSLHDALPISSSIPHSFKLGIFNFAHSSLIDVTATSAASSFVNPSASSANMRPKSANRSIQASLLNSSTAGNNIALENPCGTSNNAPIGRDKPCTKQTDAFEKAIPPCKAPSDTCSLAYTSRGFS